MFTGIIETVGTVAEVRGASPVRLTLASPWPGEPKVGDSISVDGCCLTVVETNADRIAFEAATETLARTTIGALARGDRVNLERALAVGSRLDGHLVTGHVDGVGTIGARAQRGSAVYFRIELPAELGRYVAARGSIALAGVSLTVTDVTTSACEVGIIPHTLQVTTFGNLAAGAHINVEVDLIARYVERIFHR